MVIDDLLKEKIPGYERILTEIMKDSAGEEVLRALDETFPEPDVQRDWYFSKEIRLGQKTPYDFCVAGRQDDVVNVLGRYRYGDYS